MSKREEFVNAASIGNAEEFLRFIQLHKDKTEPFVVEEVMQEMSSKQIQTLWSKLAVLLKDILQELPPEHWEKSREEGMDVEMAADPRHVMSVVDGVTLVATTSLKVLQDGHSYNDLLQIAHMLHDVLVVLPVTESPLQLQILTFFKAWWAQELEEKEKFGFTALFIALKKCFSLKKMSAEIQRVWTLHTVLLSVDYAAQASQEVIDLLVQGFVYPSFFRNDNGKRFLVFLFSWNVDLISTIHTTIKNQLEYLRKDMITHLIEIYYRAWKKATGEFKEKIENVCIQDFMENAILLHRSSPVLSKVRKIISYFHSKKSCPDVDKMLHDLYKPILWRSLSVPNFEVRANATLLFCEAFPIHDPNLGSQAIETAIQKQLDTAMDLLNDPHPTVRCMAILGVCKILAKFWELFPPGIIMDFLKKLAGELANDTSSEEVRSSVFKCLALVLDNPLSHPVLEKLIPTIKNSLHDKSEMTRVTFLDMLIKMKEVRAAKFWDVCPIEHLLARMAIDTQCIAKRITNLLSQSFFPVNESESEWCHRCITLIQMNPMAARIFYLHIHQFVTPTNIVKLMLAIRSLLNNCVKMDSDQSDESSKENSVLDEPLLVKDTAVMVGLLEIVVLLWKTIASSLKKNEEAQKYVCAKFGSVLPKYFKVFTDERCTVPLVKLASLMPADVVPTFSSGVLSKLRRMDPAASPKQYNQLLDCLCSWGQAASILELITVWLTEDLPKQPHQKKAKPSRKVQFQETVEAKPALALAYLEYLLCISSVREKVLGVDEVLLKQLLAALESWTSVLDTHLSSSAQDPCGPDVETALGVLILHGRLSAHLQYNFPSESREYLMSLERVAAWVAENVLPFLVRTSQGGEAEKSKAEETTPLAAQITKSFLKVCSTILQVGLGDEELNGHLLHLCSLTLLSEAGYMCIPEVLIILKEVVHSYVFEENRPDSEEDPTTIVLGVVANIFQKVIELMGLHLKKEPEEGRRLCQSVVPVLTEFLQVSIVWETGPLVGVFSTLVAIIIVEKRHSLQKTTHPEEVIMSESVDDMPPLSNILLSVMLKSPSVTCAFLDRVSASLDSEDLSSLIEVAAVLHVLSVIKHTGCCGAALKGTAASAQRQLNRHTATSVDGNDIQRAIYASSEKTLNEILYL